MEQNTLVFYRYIDTQQKQQLFVFDNTGFPR